MPPKNKTVASISASIVNQGGSSAEKLINALQDESVINMLSTIFQKQMKEIISSLTEENKNLKRNLNAANDSI